MTHNKKFMQDAMKRVEELKQETIEKSKKIPNSDMIIEKKLKEFSEYKSISSSSSSSIKVSIKIHK